MQKMTDKGTITALLRRLRQQRIPRLLEMEERAMKGEKLSERDFKYLEMVIADSKKVVPLFQRNPEFQAPVKKLYSLYDAITKAALHNEEHTHLAN